MNQAFMIHLKPKIDADPYHLQQLQQCCKMLIVNAKLCQMV